MAQEMKQLQIFMCDLSLIFAIYSINDQINVAVKAFYDCHDILLCTKYSS